MKRALLCSASSVVVAGQLLHIKLDDFIIIGREKHYSFYEEKLLS